jgi:hypothetical protein
MTYDEWYSEWKEMLDEAMQAERAVADYAANHGMTATEEWAEFHRLQRIVDDIRRRRDELTELYQRRVG